MKFFNKYSTTFLLLFFTFCILCSQEIQLGIESQDVYLNEAFLFQIRVSSDTELDIPIFPETANFTVEAQTPQISRSSQVSVINGKMTQQSSINTTFNYYLTPKKLGELTIPSIEINLQGNKRKTQEVKVNVREAEKIDGIILQQAASTKECYVGEAVFLKWRWYIDRKIYQYNFNIPLLNIAEFHFPDYMPEIIKGQERSYQRVANQQNSELIARQSTVRLKGKNATLFSFERPFIALKPGVYTLPATTLICEIDDQNAPRQQRRRNSPFDDFDDFFSFRNTRKRRLTISSEPLTIRVKALPTRQQNENFSGIVGKCEISVKAEPLEVNVGDPILLTLTLKGPEFLEHIKLPPFEKLLNEENFKISNEEPGIVQGKEKIFQCTLRANNDKIQEIPVIKLAYFNSEKADYDYAISEALPLKVSNVQQITLLDAHTSPIDTGANTQGKNLQSSDYGIAHNYDVKEILNAKDQDPRNFFKEKENLSLLIVPPLIWLVLLLTKIFLERLQANPELRKAKKAGKICLNNLEKIDCAKDEAIDDLFAEIQKYIATKFTLKPGIITFQDLQNILQNKNIDEKYYLPLKDIFDSCEASRFAGTNSSSAEEIRLAASKAIKNLEKAK